ncbi:glycosyltransferase family 4 protein [bacterium]|nr:glycosyltransferase family 4 protein [bacterium]
MKVAFFAVLSPCPSGISDYCHHLLPELKKLTDIDVFIDDYKVDDEAILSQFEVLHYLNFERRFNAGDYDAIIYQMGNDPCHGFMYHYMFNFPGIVVMHDYNLHPSRASMLRSSGDESTYLWELQECLGEKGREIARLICSGEQYHALLNSFPMNEKVLKSSVGVIAHNPYVAQLIEQKSPDAIVRFVNMGIPKRKRLLKKANARRALNLPLGKFIVVAPGFVGEHKKPNVALDAFAKFLKKHSNALLLFVGKPDKRLDLQRRIDEMALSDLASITGYVSDDRFDEYVAAADVVLNLRTNTLRETSGTMLRAMSLSKPVVSTRLLQNMHLPDGVCLWVEHSTDEADELALRLESLWSNPKMGDEIGKEAKMYINSQHSLKQAAEGYKQTIDDILKSNIRKSHRRLRDRLLWLPEMNDEMLAGVCDESLKEPLQEELEWAMTELGMGKPPHF